MPETPPRSWPERPRDFYNDWAVFSDHVFDTWLSQEREPSWRAVVLLACGAALGAAGLSKLVANNRDAVDRQGQEWDIEGLGAYAESSSAVLGAALGGMGVLLLMRILGNHADEKAVARLSEALELARREFEELQQDRSARLMTRAQYMAAVEHLHWRLTQQAC